MSFGEVAMLPTISLWEMVDLPSAVMPAPPMISNAVEESVLLETMLFESFRVSAVLTASIPPPPDLAELSENSEWVILRTPSPP